MFRKTTFKIILVTAVIIFGMMLWSPWINDSFARSKVIGLTTYKPKTSEIYTRWLPFGRSVSIQDMERTWFVNLFGNVHEITNIQWSWQAAFYSEQ